MKQLVLFLVCYILFMTSCQQNFDENLLLDEPQAKELSSLDSFSSLLSKAMSNSPELRSFIKKEALKMIDNDYDVFYPIVKNEIVTNNKSFRDILKQYDTENRLDKLEQDYPLLTILIPELPSGFNAETWECESEIPLITSRLRKNENSFFLNGNLELELAAEVIPGFPVLVVKNNERIVLNGSQTRSDDPLSLNSRYSFIDDAFNNKKGQKNVENTRSLPVSCYPDYEYLGTAYNEMGVTPNYWQRDNIYYGLTLNDTTGPLKRNYVEQIAVIKFSESAFGKMRDQDDLNYRDLLLKDDVLINPSTPGFWSDGKFEFKIDVIINNQAGLGTSITKYFSIEPNEIFNVVYEVKKYPWHYVCYIVKGVNSIPCYPNINLVTWDLEQNSFSWKISVFEVDDQETYTTQETYTSEFAANFGGSYGISKKIGLNFGTSAKVTKQNQYTRVTYKNSDDLGTLEINFSDPVILNFRGILNDIYTINSPYIEMGIIPVKLY